MKKILLVLVVLAVMAGLLACGKGQYQVKVSYPGDEAWVIRVCSPSIRKCGSEYGAAPVMGTGDNAPPVGTWCKPTQQDSNVLDCGKQYFKVRIVVKS